MTDQNSILPTQEQFAEWDTLYFDGERQNFDYMMLKAFQSGADRRLEQVIEQWEEVNDSNKTDIEVIREFDKRLRAMRPQEDN